MPFKKKYDLWYQSHCHFVTLSLSRTIGVTLRSFIKVDRPPKGDILPTSGGAGDPVPCQSDPRARSKGSWMIRTNSRTIGENSICFIYQWFSIRQYDLIWHSLHIKNSHGLTVDSEDWLLAVVEVLQKRYNQGLRDGTTGSGHGSVTLNPADKQRCNKQIHICYITSTITLDLK